MTERPGILLVDDDEATQVALCRDLDGAGYSVHVAPDAASGAARALERRPAIALCQIAHAQDFCRAVRADGSLAGLFVTVVGSLDDRAALAAALDAGADDFLIRPVERSVLLARVRAGLQMSDLQREMNENRRRELMLEMAVTLGHEINNPLMALLGHIDLIDDALESGDAERVRRHLAGCREGVNRLTEVARSLTELRDARRKPYLGDQEMVDLGES